MWRIELNVRSNAFGSLAFCHFSEVVYGSSTYLLRQWYLLWNIHCTRYSLRIRMKMSRKMNTGKLHSCYILCYWSVFAKYWTQNLTWHCIGADLPEVSFFLYFSYHQYEPLVQEAVSGEGLYIKPQHNFNGALLNQDSCKWGSGLSPGS